VDHYHHNPETKSDHSVCHSHSVEGYSAGRIIFTIILNLIIGLAEVTGGILSGSLSLISDALHNFSDAFAILITFIAIKLSRITETESFTFGFKRGEIIAASINSSALIVISAYLIWESHLRILHPNPIKTEIMMIVASIGVVANLLGMFLLQKDSDKSINIKSAYLHLFADAITSIAVLLGAVAIHYFKIYWLDPVLTILISLYILRESYFILKKSIIIFMMGKPDGISLEDIKRELESLKEIKNIHHAHLWMLTDKLFHFEAHIDIEDCQSTAIDSIIIRSENILKEKFGITHSTLQVESSKCRKKELIKEICNK
jgi:cobalt-zinc-cadmium efflux system protein